MGAVDGQPQVPPQELELVLERQAGDVVIAAVGVSAADVIGVIEFVTSHADFHAWSPEVSVSGVEQSAKRGGCIEAGNVIDVSLHVVGRFEIGELQVVGAIELGAHGSEDYVIGIGCGGGGAANEKQKQ